MSTRESISVVIPVFNGERYLAEAIASVREQHYAPLEIIVADDGSTDGSVALARSFPEVRCHVQSHRGAGSARNAGAAIAASPYLAFLDADDIWCAGKLNLQVNAFLEDLSLDVVFGHMTQFVSPDLSDEQRRRFRCPAGSFPAYVPSAMMIRREAFFRVGPFDDSRYGEPLDWFLRATEAGLRTRMLPDVVGRRRLHSANRGVIENDVQSYVHILKSSLDRRRALHERVT